MVRVMRGACCGLWLFAMLAGCDDGKPGEGILLGTKGDADDGDRSDSGSDAPTADPLVRLLHPVAALDPVLDDVLTDRQLEALCEVRPGSTGAPIAPTSVTVSVLVDQKVVLTQSTSSEGPDTYKAKLNLRDIPTGPVSIVCSAEDTAELPRAGEARVETFFDGGPTIRFVTPGDGAAVAATNLVPVVFAVVPAPLGATDPSADVDPASVELRVNGMQVVPRPVPGKPSDYAFDIDFSDTKLFPGSTVETVSLEVRARNLRGPVAALAQSSIQLLVDAVGPTIKLVRPLSGSIVGGQVEVAAEVTDALSGVDPGSLRFEIPHNAEAISYDLLASKPPLFAGTFQVGRYAGRSQLTINVIARDNAGNPSRLGITVELDTIPPWVSLDPPNVREITRSNGSCSSPFDPLGDDAVNDGSLMKGSDRFRMLVWERGIASSGATVVNLSGVDNKTVALYVQGDLNVPLIIDVDGDGVCDAINTSPSPAPKAPLKLDFSPVTPMGAQFRATSPDLLTTEPAVGECGATPCPPNTCKLQGASGSAPDLCSGEGRMSSIIAHTQPGPVKPVVYALQPASGSTTLNCTGKTWQTTLAGGWACVAGSAVDLAGNLGISKPIRVCYSSDCPEPPPSCTDGCTMPAVFAEQGMPRVISR